MKKIDPKSLIPMDEFTRSHKLRVDLAYARGDNLLFGEAIYRESARLWLHEDLAKIICQASRDCYDTYGFGFVLYDGLRTVEAQERMLATKRVQDNPHWLEEPRLLSPPGAGAHPRGMAVDLSLEREDGRLLDMGTDFDFLAENPHPKHNPAHREYANLSEDIKNNRLILYNAILGAGEMLGMEVMGLPQEWWDFRFPQEIYEQFAPISDQDLPLEMQMADPL